MSGYTTKRVYMNKRNVDIGRGVDKNGIPSTSGVPVMLRRFTQTRAPNSTKNQPLINGSLYFNGTGSSNILIDNGVDFELDGDFTIEWFQYQTNTLTRTHPRIFQIGTYPDAEIGFSIEDNGLTIWIKNYDWPNDNVSGGVSFIGNVSGIGGLDNAYNKWIHFVIVKKIATLECI